MPQSQAVCVSVVVACRNEIRHMRGFLDCLFCQELGPIELEILIADGRSADGTRRVLGEAAKKNAAIRLIDNPEKIAAAGLNRAIREARGEIIIRMDVHTIYAPDYVRACVEVLQETSADNVGGPARTFAEGYLAEAIAHAFHSKFASGGANFRDPRYEGSVNTVPYGCWRKSTLERFGMFDETLVRGQDDELNYRIVSSGGLVWQSPRIVSWYRPRTTLSSLFRQYFQNGFWKVAAVRKHGRPPSWRNLVPAACLFIAIALPLCALIAEAGGSLWWRNAFLAALLALVAEYFTASFAAALKIARREGWKFLPFLPVVFATCHLSYGLGFLLALLHRPAMWSGRNARRKVLTAIPK